MTPIDDYLAKVKPSQREALERVRTIAKKIVPEAEEVISYGLPTLKYKGTYILYFGAFKNHMSLFPSPAPIDKMKQKLPGFKLAKGTIQFTEDNPVPEAIIKELIETRLQAIR